MFELLIAVRSRLICRIPRKPFARRQLTDVAVESRVQLNDYIDVTLRPDVRVVSIRALQKYVEILRGVRSSWRLQYRLNCVVRVAGIRNGPLMGPRFKLRFWN